MDTDCLTKKEISAILGVSRQAIERRAKKDDWPSQNGDDYPLLSLPGQIQAAWVSSIYNGGDTTAQGHIATIIDALAPEAVQAYRDAMLPVIPSLSDAVTQKKSAFASWDEDPSRVYSLSDLSDPRVAKILDILHDVSTMPEGWTKGRRGWVELVARKHAVTWQSVYRWQTKYDKKGIAGLCHRKSTRGKAVKWSDDALEYWIGLCLKREHRHIDKRDLYDLLIVEADRRSWRIGGYNSAMDWFNKRATPQMLALQRGGMRALDNVLPPILRDYSDLAPFELLVGDQHRFDFWVTDDETGEVFRPEGYLWQDLRTRVLYGAAIDRKYDGQMIGLALQVGLSVYGAFGSIYTDNGRPELSKYIMSVMRNMRALHLAHKQTLDATMDTLDVDPEDINPHIIIPGTHKKAIVKNAKAKMIEGTFFKLESLLRSRFRVAGGTKRMDDDIHAQDIDQIEAQKLAAQGKLLTFSEFALTMYRACDYYNREKQHRGVRKEWSWKPKPKTATPYNCLEACWEMDGWRPRMISDGAATLLFLSHANRKVNMGRVQFSNDFYESDALVELHGKRVDLRYHPMDLREVYIFRGEEYLGIATPVEYSSMKDMTLAQRKIIEKRERRSTIAAEYRAITTTIPDYRKYSEISSIDKAAALIGKDRQKKAVENKEIYGTRTPEQLTAEVTAIEKLNATPAILGRKSLPARPGYFLAEIDRYEWCVKYGIAGGRLDEADAVWMLGYENRMTPDQREYWETVKAVGM